MDDEFAENWLEGIHHQGASFWKGPSHKASRHVLRQERRAEARLVRKLRKIRPCKSSRAELRAGLFCLFFAFAAVCLGAGFAM
jgi:hypothetical protein